MMAAIDALLVARTVGLTTTGDILYASGANTPARLGVGSTGNVLTVAGGVPTWATPSSSAVELAYVEYTTGNPTSTSTTFAGGTSIVSAGALTFDGSTKIRVEFYAPAFSSSSTAVNAQVSLADGGVAGTDLGLLGYTESTVNTSFYTQREFTPAAATKTYSVVLWNSGAGTASIGSGIGGAGVRFPGFIRVSRVV